jgi:multidrug transporter EmrE-like cation transporter
MVKMAQALVSVALTVLLDWQLFGEQLDVVKCIAIAFIMINVFLYKAGTVKHV